MRGGRKVKKEVMGGLRGWDVNGGVRIRRWLLRGGVIRM